jgi:hypothetical protein
MIEAVTARRPVMPSPAIPSNCADSDRLPGQLPRQTLSFLVFLNSGLRNPKFCPWLVSLTRLIWRLCHCIRHLNDQFALRV